MINNNSNNQSLCRDKQLTEVFQTLEKVMLQDEEEEVDDDDSLSSTCQSTDDNSDGSSYYSSSDDDDSEWDSDLEDEMEELKEEIMNNLAMPPVRPLHKAASSPAMMSLMQQALIGGKSAVNPLQEYRNLAVRMKTSEPSAFMQSPSYGSSQGIASSAASEKEGERKPASVLQSILKDVVSTSSFPPAMWDGFFLEIQPEFVQAHTTDMETFIRREDFDGLRTILTNGGTLQSCNRYGESVVHLAARRGTKELMQFLMTEGNVSVRVRDDCGRHPLHDACWNSHLKFDVVKILLDDSPEFLFIKDHRGFSPLDYIPRTNWEAWCTFLEDHRDFLVSKVSSLNLDEKVQDFKRDSLSTACSRRSSF